MEGSSHIEVFWKISALGIFNFTRVIQYKRNHRKCSPKTVFLKILLNSQENTCARGLSFSGTGVSLWILQNFKKIRFLQNTSERLLLSMLRVEILKICVPRSFLGGQDSGLRSRYSRLFYSFPWILGTSYFWKSCHDFFVAFFCNTLLVGCWSALIPNFSFSFLVSLKI